MRISPTWLREFVALKATPAKLAEELTRAGLALESLEGEGEQTVLDLEITTNRVDAMNHYGVARECAAIYDLELKPLKPKLPAAEGKAKFAIQIEDREGCARYTARIVRGVTIQPSPANIAKRLELMGSRPINNAADATNYTLMEMGHPTHAFDLDRLEGGKIVVRRAKAGERLKTLDGVERKLSAEDLVIADAKKAVAIAGVMGGFDSMITEQTKNVLIESAWFDPVTVRKTARRQGLHTDASHRFERGADFAATPVACARVAQLILEGGGGELEGGEIDAVARRPSRRPVWLRHSEVKRILGSGSGGSGGGPGIAEREARRILDRLGFKTKRAAREGKRVEAGLVVELPTWRLDVEREIDLIEEIARIYGYDRFPNTLPTFSGAVVERPGAEKDARLRAALLGLGYNEAISLSFIAQADAEAFSSEPPVVLANPLSEEATSMRTSLVPGMLGMLAWNLNRGTQTVRLFESGNVYARAGAKAGERKALCLGATGAVRPASPHEAARPYGFFDLKGDVETLLEIFAGDVSYDAEAGATYHPGRSARARLGDATVARFGQISRQAAEARKLRQEVFIAEIYLDQLYAQGLREPRYEPLPRFPAVERDFSFFFGEATGFGDIRDAIAALRLPEVVSVRPAEIFRGGSVPAGRYSLLVRVTFQSSQRTLRDDEVAGWATGIVQALQALGGQLRG